MIDYLAADILNELIGYELQSLAIRAIESTTYVSGLSQAEEPLVHKLASYHHKHAARLAEIVATLGASPGMRSLDATTGDLHFVELTQALPRILDYQQRLVLLYESAGQRLSDSPKASMVVAQIHEQHVSLLSEIQALASKTTNTTT